MRTPAALPEALLLDYAAGAASPAISLLMATHLSMSDDSQALLAMLETIGGAMLEDLEDEPLERISATSALALMSESVSRPVQDLPPKAEASSPRRSHGETPPGFRENDLPAPLQLAGAAANRGERWRKLGIGVAARRLPLSSDGDRAHLLWAKGGTGIATHRHVGREVVLVLKGAFWDDGVRFGAGDVAVCEDGTIHTPRIDDCEDCVCLAVTEAPVHFTGPLGLLLNRISRF